MSLQEQDSSSLKLGEIALGQLQRREAVRENSQAPRPSRAGHHLPKPPFSIQDGTGRETDTLEEL